MVINNFATFKGKHCESSSIGNLLINQNLNLSEPMIFGLGEGLSFIYWKMKSMNLPFLGGRNKQFDLTINLCRNLELELDARETTSKKKAWNNLTTFIDNGEPVPPSSINSPAKTKSTSGFLAIFIHFGSSDPSLFIPLYVKLVIGGFK